MNPLPPASLTPPRTTAWLRRHLGWAMAMAYVVATALPAPGLWLRHSHTLPGVNGAFSVALPPLLLSLVLFAAGLQVPLDELGHLLRRPVALLTGLTLHLLTPLLVIPLITFMLHRSPDSDGGSGLTAAMILIVAMPVAAGATVWTSKGRGEQSVMVGLVLASTLISPFTTPVTIGLLSPLLQGDYQGTLSRAGYGNGFALTFVLLPCGAGLLARTLLSGGSLNRLLRTAVPAALWGSLVLTYVNASGALGTFLTHPRPVLLAAALAVASTVCVLCFAVGRVTSRLLRLDASTASSVTLACGMNNSSASAVLLTTALPDRPHLLLPVLAYGLLQKLAAGRVVRDQSPR
ncbi:sodium-dependent transporter [Streptomyces chattanoogensis]|uniref:Sodium-dependent transporter n=1 Tax=Streptomyces chattanoogensis TaxID=66876 RepID=A0A0N0XWL5_9ACTN|nr:sodium-dependent transporter [Streptomyces chattanoogensis]KPC62537.1 sodium-dependent transporter [Streptomyces chattanoogensis]